MGISKWDVSRVSDMSAVFNGAASFNGDISKWDVSSVKDMGSMFHNAKSFAQVLCGDAWVNSKAEQGDMFTGSSGSIPAAPSTTSSTTTSTRAFSPNSKSELKDAIDTCNNDCAR